MKARIFPHILDAQTWNREVSAHLCHGSDSLYLYSMRDLSTSTVVDKPTYAQAKGIQRHTYDAEDNQIETDAYQTLNLEEYTLPQVGVVVGSAFNTVDEEGNPVEPEWLEDIGGSLPEYGL